MVHSGSHPGQDANGSYNKELLNGYLNAGPAGWNPPITDSHVTLTQIPYAQYNIYVYFSSDAANRPGYVTDGTTSYFFNTLRVRQHRQQRCASGSNHGDQQRANHPGANYAVFSGLSGASQTITVQMEQNDLWGGIAGFGRCCARPSALALGAIGLMLRRVSRRRVS